MTLSKKHYKNLSSTNRGNKSLLNNPLVLNMMKYFKNTVKSQIISQQVIDIYRNEASSCKFNKI